MKKIIFLFAAIVALTSCSITKRHYAPGYHVEWKGKGTHLELPQTQIAERVEKAESNTEIENIETAVSETDTESAVSNFSNPLEDIQLNGVESFQENVIEESLSKVLDESKSFESNDYAFSQEIVEAPVYALPGEGDVNTMALVGFILSMSSLLLVLTGLPGLIVSAIGLKQINEGRGEGKGLAIAGIVVGAIYTLLVLLYAALIAFEVFAII
ncbi:MAG: DUF4190 domain-containing protein [Bacteroidetes bacterium]|nr:DUF4190 domain-containing protein [Bacteroidota bacterium]